MPVKGWQRTTIALLLFGMSFGYVEAAVVCYMRELYEPVHQRFHPGRAPDDLFPLLQPEQLGPEQRQVMVAEIGREAATLVMLASVGAAVGRNSGQSLAAFAIAFGIWDISFYAFLKLLLDWPGSLLTWDVLFLLPVPWVGPVLAPVVTSLSLIGAGFVYLGWEWRGRPVRLDLRHWFGLATGGLVVVAAFTWDFRNVLSGGMPSAFHWPLFLFGEIIGTGTFLHALRASAARPVGDNVAGEEHA